VYKGSHAHDCSAVPGGFPELLGNHYRLLAEGVDDGHFGPWYPAASGNTLGPRVFATDGRRLFVGGDFHTINSKPQQGFARFDAAPDITPPIKPAAPKVSSVEPGTVKIIVPATWDRDDDQLTYILRRDGASTPIQTWTVEAKAWELPTVVRQDSGLAPGSTHTYTVQVTDGTFTVKSPVSVPVTVANSAQPYRAQVTSDFPLFYWRLGEASGTTAADATGNGATGIYGTGTHLGQLGALTGDSDTAVEFDGSSGRVSSTALYNNPQELSLELLFKTTTTRGGKLIGFGDSQSGSSDAFDRHVYMTNSGQLIFAVKPGSWGLVHKVKIFTPLTYNDGVWHLVDATLGPDGMALYVDGIKVGSNATTMAESLNGYWRVAGDSLSGWVSQPSSDYFSGTIDEVAVYGYALSPDQVADHQASR
jgi:hypothetical protein